MGRRRRTTEDQEASHIGIAIVIVTDENFHPPLPPAQPWEMLLLRKRDHRHSSTKKQGVVIVGMEEWVLKRCSRVVT